MGDTTDYPPLGYGAMTMGEISNVQKKLMEQKAEIEKLLGVIADAANTENAHLAEIDRLKSALLVKKQQAEIKKLRVALVKVNEHVRLGETAEAGNEIDLALGGDDG